MTTIQEFKERKLYDEILPLDYFNQNFIDFTTLNRYGTVNTKNNLIFPRFDKMKPFKESKGIEVLSFVSLAYETMMKELQQRVASGNWENNSIFPTLKPATGFVDPVAAFDKFMTEQFGKLIPLIYKNRNIQDFKSFLSVFQEYVGGVKYKFPYTLPGFLERANNPQYTGLQIEFVEGEKNNFDLKGAFISDPGFKRYLLLAEKHGFYVNRNSPWSLIANIDSPAMQIYASQDAGINIGTKGILERYFQEAVSVSFDFFTKYLIGSYNAVASSEPFYSYLVHDGNLCTGYKKIVIQREEVTNFSVETTANLDLLQLLYLMTRYYETFSDKVQYKNVLRKYRAQKGVTHNQFSDLVERLVGPAKNSSILFYGISGATSVTSFEFPFDAEEFAAKLGSSGAHQMPNGRWMPCKTHEEYISLTSG